MWRSPPANELGECWALLGEMDKVASVSGVRFEAVESTRTSLTVRGVGVAGEVLSLGAVAPGGATRLERQLSVVRVVVGTSGTFSHTWQ